MLLLIEQVSPLAQMFECVSLRTCFRDPSILPHQSKRSRGPMTQVPLLTWARVSQWQSIAKGISTDLVFRPCCMFQQLERRRGRIAYPRPSFQKFAGRWVTQKTSLPSLGLLLASTWGPE